MKMVITGASGFVGRNLVPQLKGAGVELLLVGRFPSKLDAIFPGIPHCGYEELISRASGYDILLHLAAANTGSSLPVEAFFETDVEFVLQILEKAKVAGVKRFVNVSSTRAIDTRARAAHAQGKRDAAKLLEATADIDFVTVYLPLVYAQHWNGKLSVLNQLPRPFSKFLFYVLSACVPTVHVAQLARTLLDLDSFDRNCEIIIAADQSSNRLFRIVKRTIDLVAASSILVLFWWAFLLIWFLIRSQSPGPGIFAQQRIGRNGDVFICYKFRTMRKGTLQKATHEVSANNITSLGRFLRKTKIDELPQVWNILRNDMSLIGPRPCLTVQVELTEARRARGILKLKPGISGLAQVNGIDMSNTERLVCSDARYLSLRSLLLDLKLAISTAVGRGQGDRVL